ncbi:MAG: glycosyltransferase family 9 protein [Candidatus Omnitrophica bacterium]|nr:glycosyltransferase family 9 protein [Candidatus Omnitrophota bacterium]
MVNKILIINPFGIGDVLFTTPLIRAIKEFSPETFLGYWCNERVSPILINNPFIDRIFPLARGDLKKIFENRKFKGIKKAFDLFFTIKKEKFDLAIDFSLDYRYSLICKLCGIRRRLGFNYKNRNRFLTEKIDIDGYKDKHVVDYYLIILKFLNFPLPENPRLEIFIPEEEKLWVDEFLKNNNIRENDLLIGIAPAGGASWGRDAFYLHWPIENFISLCESIIKKNIGRIIILGNFDEKLICEKIEDKLKGKILNTAGQLSLNKFLALLSRLNVLVCNDAGPLHMGVGLGIKTVCICGPVDEKVYGPYPLNQNHRVIKKDFTCRPCYKKFRFSSCQYNLDCLRSIGVEEVFSAIISLLYKSS